MRPSCRLLALLRQGYKDHHHVGAACLGTDPSSGIWRLGQAGPGVLQAPWPQVHTCCCFMAQAQMHSSVARDIAEHNKQSGARRQYDSQQRQGGTAASRASRSPRVAEEDVDGGLLTYKLMHAKSLEELQQIAAARSHVMNAIHVSVLAARAVELGAIGNPGGAKQLLDAYCPLLLQPAASAWTFRELVEVLWCYGRLRHSPSQELETGLLVPLLSQGLPRPVTQMNSKELAKLATAFSMMRRHDRLAWMVLEEACVQKMAKFDTRGLSAEYSSDPLLMQAAKHAELFLTDFTPQDLSRVLQSLARLKCTDAIFISQLADEVRRQVIDFTAADILRSLTAFEQLRSVYESPRCVAALAKATRKNIELFAAGDLVKLAQLFQNLQSDDAGLYHTLGAALTSRLADLSIEQLVAAATSLSGTGRGMRLFHALLDELARDSNYFTLQQQGQVLSACADAGATSMAVVLQLLKRAVAGGQQGPSTSLQGWASLLRAVSRVFEASQDATLLSMRLTADGGTKGTPGQKDGLALATEQTQELVQLVQQAVQRVMMLLGSEQLQQHKQSRGGKAAGQAKQPQTTTAAAASIVSSTATLRHFDAPLCAVACRMVLANPERLAPSQAAGLVQALGALSPALQAHPCILKAAQNSVGEVLQTLRLRLRRQQRGNAAAAAAAHAPEAGLTANASEPGLGLSPQQAASALSGVMQLGDGLQDVPLRHILYDLTSMPAKAQKVLSKASVDSSQELKQDTVGALRLQGGPERAAGAKDAGRLQGWQAAEALRALEVLERQRQGMPLLPERAIRGLEQLAGWHWNNTGKAQQDSSNGSAADGHPITFALNVFSTLKAMGLELQRRQATPGSYFSVWCLAAADAGSGAVPNAGAQGTGPVGQALDDLSRVSQNPLLSKGAVTPADTSRSAGPYGSTSGSVQLTAVELVAEQQSTLSQPRQLLGPVALRQRYLLQLGYRVLAVQEHVWAALGSDDARRRYLQGKLNKL